MTTPPPAVACTSCSRTWNSASMAEGLRLVGACPRCGGVLEFSDTEAAGDPTAGAPAGTADPADRGLAPHLVLGIPRR